MTVVARRKLTTELTHEADGSISGMRIKVQYTQDNDLNATLNLAQEEWIAIGLADMTAGDKAASTAYASRVEAMIERVRPLRVP